MVRLLNAASALFGAVFALAVVTGTLTLPRAASADTVIGNGCSTGCDADNGPNGAQCSSDNKDSKCNGTTPCTDCTCQEYTEKYKCQARPG